VGHRHEKGQRKEKDRDKAALVGRLEG
jgi:hypothetical protein